MDWLSFKPLYLFVLAGLLSYFPPCNLQAAHVNRSKAARIHFGPGPSGTDPIATIHFGPGPNGKTAAPTIHFGPGPGANQIEFQQFSPHYLIRNSGKR